MRSQAPPSQSPTSWKAANRRLEEHATAALQSYRALLQFQARTSRLRGGTLRELGLTHSRLRVLAVVVAAPGLSISAIARELDLSRQAVHRVVHEMERGRALQIERSNRDRRIRQLRLTAMGRHIAALAVPWEREWTAQVLNDARTTHLNGIAAISNHIRLKLPWTVRGPDESEVQFFGISRTQRLLRSLEPVADEYAVRATVSPILQSAHPSAGTRRSESWETL
jgi:DNA-binding MarR family transcriptional regulator